MVNVGLAITDVYFFILVFNALSNLRQKDARSRKGFFLHGLIESAS